MTQDEGTTEQFQEDNESTGAPPHNPMECGKYLINIMAS
jgi:hypothetical protein